MRRFPILVIAAFALSAAPAWADQAITIQDCGANCYKFSPQAVPAASGEKVTWTNNSTHPHNITRCDPSNCPVTGGTGPDSWNPSGTLTPSGGTYQHTFTGNGTYVYYCSIHGYAALHGTITVSGGGGAPPPADTPTASFTTNPSSPSTGQAVSFDGSASIDSDGESLTYRWTFGDTATQTTAVPTTTHAYAAAGTYTASLTVVDSKGNASSPATHTVVVAAQPVSTPPTPSVTPPPTLSQPHLSTAKLCARRSRSCKRTSAMVRFKLSAAGKVGLVVKRGHKTVRHRMVNAKLGANSLPLSATGLKPGRYMLVLTPVGGSAVHLLFTVLAG